MPNYVEMLRLYEAGFNREPKSQIRCKRQLFTIYVGINDSYHYGKKKKNNMAQKKLLNEEQETQEIATDEQEIILTDKIIYKLLSFYQLKYT